MAFGGFLKSTLLEDLSRVPDSACNFDTCGFNAKGKPGGAALYSFGLRHGGALNTPAFESSRVGYSFGVDFACSVLDFRRIWDVSFLPII